MTQPWIPFPSYWLSFIEKHNLVGREFAVPEEADLSGSGIEIEILSQQSSVEEQTLAYPGIEVLKAGYVPVGGCSGTGDPYFIRLQDGENGPLYQIYHDEVFDEGYDPARAIVKVLDDYRELLKYPREP